MIEIEFILYVNNQERSKVFYEKLLLKKPVLDVSGMTEFMLFDKVKLGLMPEDSIAKIISSKLPHPKTGNGIPRCEIYLKLQDAGMHIKRGIKAGGKLISPLQDRDWGDKVGYISDLDGHIIAIAEKKYI